MKNIGRISWTESDCGGEDVCFRCRWLGEDGHWADATGEEKASRVKSQSEHGGLGDGMCKGLKAGYTVSMLWNLLGKKMKTSKIHEAKTDNI